MRRFFADGFFSITCVVEIFTTAGSTRFTIPENEFEDGIESGTASGVALPANAKFFIAEVLPEITVPIKIPTVSVNAIASPAIHVLCRLVPTASRTCSLVLPCIVPLLLFCLPQPLAWEHTHVPLL